MTLLEILVRELPKRGGWPGDAVAISVSSNMAVYAHERMPTRIIGGVWTDENEDTFGKYGRVFFLGESQDYREKPVTREQYEVALAAVEPDWNGEGLPPLNTEVEFIMESALTPKWNRCKLMGYSEFGIAIQPLNGEFSGHVVWWSIPGKGESVKFRPICSEADRKRDEAIKPMVEVYRNALGATEDAFSEVYSAIAAGKIPHLKIV